MQLGPKQKRWINALRSGEYKQGRSHLQDVNGNYCCLGVACEVDDELMFARDSEGRLKGKALSDVVLGDSFPRSYADYIGLRSALGVPDTKNLDRAEEAVEFVEKMTGEELLEDESTSLEQILDYLALFRLNDNFTLTFKQIAAVLETFPDLYFSESK